MKSRLVGRAGTVFFIAVLMLLFFLKDGPVEIIKLAPVQPREALLKLIEGRPFKLRLKSEYSGHNPQQLVYSLKSGPADMRVDTQYGVRLIWDNPQSGADGNPIPVTVEVSDGERTAEMTLELTVTAGRLLETQINDRVVTVTDDNSNLKGLRFEFLTAEGNPQDLKIFAMDASMLPVVHSAYPPASELFYISPRVSGSIKMEMPVDRFSQEVSYTTHFFDLMKWIDHEVFDREAGFWRPELSADNYHTDAVIGEVLDFKASSNQLHGLYYLAVTTRKVPLVLLRQNVHILEIASLGASGVAGAKGAVGGSEIVCTPKLVGENEKTDFADQRCHLQGQSLSIRVKRFGGEASSTQWGGTDIKTLASWVFTAQSEAEERMGMADSGEVIVELVSPGSAEPLRSFNCPAIYGDILSNLSGELFGG